ncbi:MAG: electron transport complex subunit E [Deltaproteobacteria bacterium]|nr:electron transport complex subunit E [Deltaproteobacteria bacterium]MCK5009024.1 electron transport complex subunit E [Deltaproteobacteria bacterium]MCK5185996.1 electron transport complex subunit E [Deltaproteobacteria bacterium]MCK5422489.1 electron transport complex subunit E [Deltaproteobacteria bacterium]NOQ86001.1 RnfABCDGE type electron transport complex subunit E [Deltaproteobacteria bacterium]
MGFFSEFIKGLWRENPVFRIVLGICPTLAVSTQLSNGLGMGLAATFVLVGSNVFISLIRNVIPDKIRIPAFIVVISTFVTVVDLFMAAYTPALHERLGIFIPLIVVNCIILGRAEAFASKSTVWMSIADALGMGGGFTLALTLISSIRELLGNGTLLGIHVFPAAYSPAVIMILPPGAFLTIGILLGLFNYLSNRKSP